ncbi:BatD family protein [Sulfurimonas sp. SAG-AH-194-C21]|nr:hypothetical protein [Sulfurimonas sp. SAG-AH-194-C21]MDF1882919.1 BatD family protein [Sulfurimonas sp. SAG-AH-194-C21]
MQLTSIVFLLLILLDLSASTYKWSASTDKKTAYVNEAILLTYVCEFSDASELYTIDFNPIQDNESFSIKLLKESQGLKNLKRVNYYEFIAYVKKEGSISFDFDVVMKKTTQESIDSTTKGHYDDSKSESFIFTPLKQIPLSLEIKTTPSALIGEFELKIKHDKTSLSAYEPYHLEFQIHGLGKLSSISPVNFTIDGVKVFTQGVVLKSELTKSGEKSVWSQKFAFVSEQSFVVPEVQIEYFDVKTDSLQTLKFNEINISVDKVAFKKEDLLDMEEKESLFFQKEYLYALLSFLAGFLVAKIKLKRPKADNTQEKLFCKHIKEANSLEKLSFLLVNKDVKKYEEIISKIESKELTSLKKAKNLICS